MPDLQSTSVSATMRGKVTSVVGGMAASMPADDNIFNTQVVFSDGVGANKAEEIGGKSVDLAPTGTFVFDLEAIPGLGANIDFTKIKAFVLINSGVDPVDIVEWGYDGAVTNPWVSFVLNTGSPSARIVMPPESFLMFGTKSVAGLAVGSSNKSFRAKNNGSNTVNVTLKVIGEVT